MNDKKIITDSELEKIMLASARALPDAPSDRGMRPAQIKRALSEPVRMLIQLLNNRLSAFVSEDGDVDTGFAACKETAIENLYDCLLWYDRLDRDENSCIVDRINPGKCAVIGNASFMLDTALFASNEWTVEVSLHAEALRNILRFSAINDYIRVNCIGDKYEFSYSINGVGNSVSRDAIGECVVVLAKSEDVVSVYFNGEIILKIKLPDNEFFFTEYRIGDDRGCFFNFLRVYGRAFNDKDAGRSKTSAEYRREKINNGESFKLDILFNYAKEHLKTARLLKELEILSAEINRHLSAVENTCNGVGNRLISLESDAVCDVSLSLSENDYKLTLITENKDGVELKRESVDLPLEKIIVDGEYKVDSEHGSCIQLTLDNGNVIHIPVGDLIDGLASSGDVGAVNTRVDTLQSTLEEYKTALDEFDTRILDVEEAQKSVENIASAVKKIEEIEGHVEELDNEQVRIGGEFYTISKKVDDLGKSVSDIGTALNDEIARATGAEKGLSERILTISALAQNNQGSISALNTKVQEIDDAYVNANEVKGFIDEALDNFKGDITVDMELSDTSIHPIANKVVAEALKGKLDRGTGTIAASKVLVTDMNGKIVSSSTDSNKLDLIQGLKAGAQAQIDNLNTEIDARAKTIEYSWESVGADGINPFKLNLTLKDANGNQLSTTQIDFPLEQMVVDAEYDKVNKQLILMLPDTQIPVPVADIFEGLVTDSNIGDKTAGKAKVLETARKITFEGDVTGEYTFDGSSGKIVTLTVADDSHDHVISNIDGLQAALDNKADKTALDTTNATLVGHTNALNDLEPRMGAVEEGKLDKSECSKFYSRKGMTLSSYGWYRVAKFNANNILSVAYGSMANSCDIIIQSGYFYYSPSTHRIQLLSRYHNSKFQSLFDFGEGRLFSKIRHVVDTNNNCAYIDIYYNVDTENPVFVEILNGHSVNDYWWEAIDPYMVAATTDGEDVRCVHELGTNTTLINSGNYNSYALPITGGTMSGELKTHSSTLPFQDISTGIEAGVKSTRIQAVDLIVSTITLGNNSAGYSSNLPLVIRKYNTVSSANPANTTDLLTIDTNGNIKGYIEAVQGGGGGYLRIDRIDNEVNLENTTNHCILLGKPYRDKIEFYEYGGEFNFYKSQENVNTLLLHIHPDTFQYKGQNIIHSGNYETYIRNYMNKTILEQPY